MIFDFDNNAVVKLNFHVSPLAVNDIKNTSALLLYDEAKYIV